MIGFDQFRDETIKKYHSDYGCGRKMSAEEIGHEFDMIIGQSGYDNFVRVEKLYQKKNQAFPDPVKSACDQMDMLI